jgi:hypothetical protein
MDESGSMAQFNNIGNKSFHIYLGGNCVCKAGWRWLSKANWKN